MQLNYLIFDASDDGEGIGTWEAMASVRATDLAAVLAEARAVLAAAERRAPGPRGPLDEDGLWDATLDQHPDGGDRTRVTLTITGPWVWGEELLANPDGT